MRATALPTLLLLCLAPLVADAQIYRWTDANGTVHYGQTPPAGGDFKRMRGYEEAGASRSGTSSGKGASTFLRDSAKASSADEEARRAAVQAKAERAERCAKARERISDLEQKTAHRMFTKGPDGQPSRMTDEQYDQLIGDARKQSRDSCG